MSAVEHELWEQIRKLDIRQQRRVLEFVHRLARHGAGNEAPIWTEQEINELIQARRKTFKELVEWLEANPPAEPWGDLKDDEHAGEYIHRMRRQTAITLEEPGEDE